MARFLANLDGSRGEPLLSEKARKLMVEPPPKPLKPRENGTYFGLGWDSVTVKDKAYGYFKDGSFQGMRTYMRRLPTGVNWALLYNASMEFDPQDRQIAAGVDNAAGDIEAAQRIPRAIDGKAFCYPAKIDPDLAGSKANGV